MWQHLRLMSFRPKKMQYQFLEYFTATNTHVLWRKYEQILNNFTFCIFFCLFYGLLYMSIVNFGNFLSYHGSHLSSPILSHWNPSSYAFSVSLCLYLCLSLSFSLSVCHFVCVSFCVCLCMYVSMCVHVNAQWSVPLHWIMFDCMSMGKQLHTWAEASCL